LDGDTEVTLADRVLTQEHVIYPAALAAFASGRVPRRPPANAALLNPLPL
jgi:phosphoribosylglycinamide formyltransferase-1